MKIRRILWCTLLTLAAGCTVLEGPSPTNEYIGKQLTVKAVFGGDQDTKTVVNPDRSVFWTPGDAINLFYGSTAAGKFTTDITEPASIVEFHGILGTATGSMNEGMEAQSFWAVYPYQEDNTCDGSSVTLSIPSIQAGKAGTFADKLNPTVATAPGLSLAFYNVASWFCFTVTQEGVTAATLRGNADEDIAGKIRVTMEDGVPAATVVEGQGKKSITITAPEGGFEVGKIYYIVLIPGTFPSGVTLTLYQGTAFAHCVIDEELFFLRNTLIGKQDADAGLVYMDSTPEAVDLGLSVKWASWNLGATAPEEFGNHYAWGETEPKETYNWSTYKWCGQTSSSMTKYCLDPDFGIVDDLAALELEDDAANSLLGPGWRMPSHDEWVELRQNSTCSWTTVNGVRGYLLTSTVEHFTDKSIFLPAAGLYDDDIHKDLSAGSYWSGTLGSHNTPYNVDFDYGGIYLDNNASHSRQRGLSIRPVYDESIDVFKVTLSHAGELSSLIPAEKKDMIRKLVIVGEINGTDVLFFRGMRGLTHIDLTDATVVEGGDAFIQYGESFVGYTFSDGQTVGRWTTADRYTHNDQADYMFCGMPQLEEIKLPKNLKGLGVDAFYGCHNLTQIVIPKTVVASVHDQQSFFSCTSLVDIIVEEGGNYLYSRDGCLFGWPVEMERNTILLAIPAARESYTIPADVELLHWYTIPEGSQLKELTLLSQSPEMLPYFFDKLCNLLNFNVSPDNNLYADVNGVLYSKDLKTLVCYPSGRTDETYEILDGVTVIGDGCFNTSLFLKRMIVPEGVTRLGNSSFLACRSLESLCLPSTLQTIDGLALQQCGSLKTITCYAPTPPAVADEYTFWDLDPDRILVPAAAVNDYKNADYWNAYADKIQAIPVEVPEVVDLGLSVKWASFNLFATSPEETGGYFAWGDIAPTDKDKTGWPGYRWCNGAKYTLTKYNTDPDFGYVDNKVTLVDADDAAHMLLAGKWRMPTISELEELLDESKCQWTPAQLNGVKGYWITSKIPDYTDNSIFLPIQPYSRDLEADWDLTQGYQLGLYWSSSMDGPYGIVSQDSAYVLAFDNPEDPINEPMNVGDPPEPFVGLDALFRFNRFSIRPVYDDRP